MDEVLVVRVLCLHSVGWCLSPEFSFKFSFIYTIYNLLVEFGLGEY